MVPTIGIEGREVMIEMKITIEEGFSFMSEVEEEQTPRVQDEWVSKVLADIMDE